MVQRIPVSCVCFIAFARARICNTRTRTRKNTHTRVFARAAWGQNTDTPSFTRGCAFGVRSPKTEPRGVRSAPCCRSARWPHLTPASLHSYAVTSVRSCVRSDRGSSVVSLRDCWTKRMNVFRSIRVSRFVSRDRWCQPRPTVGHARGLPTPRSLRGRRPLWF